jgi:hypothetical protein
MPTLYQKLVDKIDELLGGEIIKTSVYSCKPAPFNPKGCDVIVKIPRPIILEDVMRAIDMADKKRHWSFFVNGYLIEHKSGAVKPTLKWELGKTLSQQSEETVEAILEILK